MILALGISVCVAVFALRTLRSSYLGFLWLERVSVIGVAAGVFLVVWRMRRLAVGLTIAVITTVGFLFLLIPAYLRWSHDFCNPSVVKRLRELFHHGKEIVSTIAVDLDGQQTDVELVLWKSFAKHPAAKIETETTVETWPHDWTNACGSLLIAAEEQRMDLNSLRNCLDAIWRYQATDSSEIVVMPVAAFSITSLGKPAWVVVCRWETFGFLNGGGSLCHVRAWALDAKTGNKIAFVTCM